MTTIELRISGAGHAHAWRFSGPSGWDELSPRQAVVLMRFRERINGDLTLLFPVLELLYGLKLSQQRWLFDERFLVKKGLSGPERQHALGCGQALIDTLEWVGLSEPGDCFLVPSFRLLDFQYGSARVLLGRSLHQAYYHGPLAGLASSSFGEFMHAENAYKANNLALLAAILYRPVRADAAGLSKDADRRQEFSADQVDDRAELFTQIDPALAQLIAHQFAASKQTLLRIFPRVFSQPADEEQTKQKKPASTSPAGWLDVAIGLAKLDVTKIALIEQTNLYLALKVLDEQIRQADEMEQQMETMRR